ncbi:MAG: CBS domain-containing protein, partial [Acidobacteriota bacterium]
MSREFSMVTEIKTDSKKKRRTRTASKKKALLERQAGEIMSKVIFTLAASSTIRQAFDKMNRYRVNVLPLISQDRVIGAVSRQTVDGALSHGLGKARVQDVASSEVGVVLPETPLMEVRRVLLQSNLGFVLVGKNRKNFQGIISRMLLFQHLPEAKVGESRRRIRLESMMERKISPRILTILHAVRPLAETMELRPYLVGGLVRDLLLGRENTDVDLVVEGDGILFARELQKALGGTVRTHENFGTAVLVLPDGFKVDLASSRTEFYAKPGALPTVQQGDIHHDLYRRDFTINAMAVELHPKHYGRLVDRFGGNRDLDAKTIRVLHSLSFIEDPTRAYRAVRFANRLNFKISPETSTYIRVGVRKKMFRHLSGDRLLREVIFILMENRPLGSLRMLSQFGLLGVLHPSLKLTGGRLGLLNR